MDYNEFSSPTIEEAHFRNLLAQTINCKKRNGKRFAAQFELANFLSNSGYKLQEAQSLQLEVLNFYGEKNRLKYNRARYLKTLLSLSKIYFKQGKFVSAFLRAQEFQSKYNETPITSLTQLNSEIEFLMLTMKASGVIPININSKFTYSFGKDLHAIYEETQALFKEHTSYQHINTVNVRNKFALQRASNFLLLHNHNISEIETLKLGYIIDYIHALKDAKYSDPTLLELMLSLALKNYRDVCNSKIGEYILTLLDNNKIFDLVKNINATAVKAMCSPHKPEHINSYIDKLNLFLENKPKDFSILAVPELRLYFDLLVDKGNWEQLDDASNILIKLLHIKQQTNPIINKGQLDKSSSDSSISSNPYWKKQLLRNNLIKAHRLGDDDLKEAILAELAIIEGTASEGQKNESASSIDLKRIQSKLPDNESLALVLQSHRKQFVLVANNKSAEVIVSNSNKSQQINKVNTLRTLLEDKSSDVEQLKALSKSIINLQSLKPHTRSLSLISDDSLHAFPSALIVDNDQWASKFVNIKRYLSMASFSNINAHKQNTSQYNTRFAVATPSFDSFNKVKLQSKLTDFLAQLAPLDGTQYEANALLKSAQTPLKLLYDDATKHNVLSQANGSWDIVLFSTHSIRPSIETGLDYFSLALTAEKNEVSYPGLLTTIDIAKANFSNSWVILAACETAAKFGDNNFLGTMVDSFFIAGAHSVMASHWRIDDHETKDFIKMLSRKIVDGRTHVEALGEARKTLINRRKPPRTWSAFDIYL